MALLEWQTLLHECLPQQVLWGLTCALQTQKLATISTTTHQPIPIQRSLHVEPLCAIQLPCHLPQHIGKLPLKVWLNVRKAALLLLLRLLRLLRWLHLQHLQLQHVQWLMFLLLRLLVLLQLLPLFLLHLLHLRLLLRLLRQVLLMQLLLLQWTFLQWMFLQLQV